MSSAFLTFKPLSLKTTRSASVRDMALRVTGHNLRSALAANPDYDLGGRINPAMSSENIVLGGHKDAAAASEAYVSALNELGVRFRRNATLAIEAVVSIHADAEIDFRTFFAECGQWIVDRFDAVPWLSTIHMDQTQPHVHVVFVPLDFDSEPPKLRGSAVLGDRATLRRIQEDFYSQVCRKYGLAKNRATRPLSASARRAAVQHARTVLGAHSGLSDAVLDALLRPHLSDPAPLLAVLNIPVPTSAPRTGTFADVWTKPVEPEKTRSPIGLFGDRKKPYRTLRVQAAVASEKLLPPCRGFSPRVISSFSHRMFSATSPDTCRPLQ